MKKFNIIKQISSVFLSIIILAGFSIALSKDVILATTTSTVDSGLLEVLVSLFEKQSGYTVKTVGVGSGMAIKMGEGGEADLLLVHSPKDEKRFIANGFGINRKALMHNDFVLLGPVSDPARVHSAKNIREAFGRIAQTKSCFVSRGDQSGTYKKELFLWPKNTAFSNLKYLESGQGMAAVLMIADQKNGYTLSDRATYLSFKDKIKLVILYEKDKLLLNPYHIIEVNPKKFPRVNSAGARAFSSFLVSPTAQRIIADFGKERYKEPLFFSDVY